MNRSFTLFLSLLLLLPAYGIAQISYTDLFDSSTFRRSTDPGKPVGTIAGSAATNASGAAVYTIPVIVAPGTHDLAPRLSVQYNSQSPNGLLGQGWQLQGLSLISRAGWDHYHHAKAAPPVYSKPDVFVLDGNYLYSKSGAYGSPGSTYVTEAEHWSVITAYGTTGGGPEYFTVLQKDGTLMEYGHSEDARMMSDDGAVVLFWRLSKVQDAAGNYMTFEYDNSGRQSGISSIRYTGNSTAGLDPYNEIRFSYQEREDKVCVYEHGYTVNSSKLLRKIEARSDGTVYKTYSFDYGKNNGASYLKSITESDASGVSLHDTRFLYGPRAPGISESTQAFSSTADTRVAADDFDGDGLADILSCETQQKDGRKWSKHLNIYKRTAANASYFRVASMDFADENTLVENTETTSNDYTQQSADFNGDGRADVVISNSVFSGWTPASSGGRTLEWIKIFYADTNGGIAAVPDYSYTPPAIYKSVHSGTSGKQHYFFSGDFDGNGRADFITVLGGQLLYHEPAAGVKDKAVVLPAGMSAASFFHDADGVYVINADGDAKTELMIVEGYKTRLFRFNFNAVLYELHLEQIGADMSFPDWRTRLLFGDFNGDGKTDLFAGQPHTTGYVPSWKIWYSDGKGFVPAAASFDAMVSGASADLSQDLRIGDFNGDGKSDVYDFYYYKSYKGVVKQHQVFYNAGNRFIPEFTDATLFAGKNSIIADFNGDGKADIDADQRSISIISFHAFDRSHLLAKVTDGFNRTTEFQYNWLTYGAAGSGDFYARGRGENYPVNNVSYPIPVVTALKEPDGIGGTNTTWFGYVNLRLHRAGRGLLGFEQTRSYNVNTDIRLNTTYDLDRTHYVPGLKPTETWLNSTGAALTRTDNSTYCALNPAGTALRAGGNKAFVQLPLETVSKDLLPGTATTTVYTYDGSMSSGIYSGNGNVIRSLTTISGGPETIVSELNTTYIATAGVPIPNKPSVVVKRTTRGAKAPAAERSLMAYDSKGQLIRLTTQPEPAATLANTVVFRYAYDVFGNRIQEEQRCAPGLIPAALWPETNKLYDASGRFAVASVNVFGDTGRASYHPFWGTPLSVTGPDGLTHTYSYDSWGNLATESVPVTAATAYSIRYNKGWSISGLQLYYTEKEDPAVPRSKTYYDAQGRVLKEEVQGFSAIAQTLTAYDKNGNVRTSTNSHYAGETPLLTTNSYDALNRLSSSAGPSGTTVYSYSSGSGLLRTTVTLPDGTVQSTVTDVIGKAVKSRKGIAGTLHYGYDSRGMEISAQLGTETMPYQTMVTREYDALGRLLQMNDPDAGTTTYRYNVFGQLTREVYASGKVSTTSYDIAGRPVQRSLDGYEYRWNYADKHSGYALKSASLTLPSGVVSSEEQYTYDSGGRISSQQRVVAGRVIEKQYTYDDYGRLLTTDYLPSHFSTRRHYDANAYLRRITTNFYSGGTGDKILYEARAKNGSGQLTAYKRADGLASAISYDHDLPTAYITAGVQDLRLGYDYANGNLLSRSDIITRTREDFTYDAASRLIRAQAQQLAAPGGRPAALHPALTMTYDAPFWGSLGRMTSKSDVGTYTYSGTPRNAVKSITDPKGLISHATQEISYTPFDKTALIREEIAGIPNELSYNYNSAEERVYSELKQGGTLSRRRWYMGDYEIDANAASGPEDHIHYISGDAGLCTIVVQNAKSGAFSYYSVYTDHLGSITAVTDAAGAVVARQSFDAWGRERDPLTWSVSAVPAAKPSWLYRGFTGHEMLPGFELINMNGRMYDPLNGRMLRPDNNVSFPGNSQAYNRYSYALNNPLGYTDPDGEWLHIVAGAVVGGLFNVAMHAGQIHGWRDAAVAFGVGAVAGGVAAATGGASLAGSATIAGSIGNGMISAAMSYSSSQAILSTGNTIYFGDPAPTARQLMQGMAISALSGGLINGVSAAAQGLPLWRVSLPEPSTAPLVGMMAGDPTDYANNSIKINQLYGRGELKEVVIEGRRSTGAYDGVRTVSKYLQIQGVPRAYRKQILESYEMGTISLRTADNATFGLRFYGGTANQSGGYLFPTFTNYTNRAGLALLPNWNSMSGISQFQIAPGSTYIFGRAASQGGIYIGGSYQMYINNLNNLIK